MIRDPVVISICERRKYRSGAENIRRPRDRFDRAAARASAYTLTQINRLVDSGTLGHPFKHVDLIEIAPERPAGFFNYFIERKKVFKRAYSEAIKAFSAIGTTSRAGGER
jgi:hypothetical protein